MEELGVECLSNTIGVLHVDNFWITDSSVPKSSPGLQYVIPSSAFPTRFVFNTLKAISSEHIDHDLRQQP